MDARTSFVTRVSWSSPEEAIMSMDLRQVRLTSRVGGYRLIIETRVALDADQGIHPRVMAELWADVSVHPAGGSPVHLGRVVGLDPIMYETANAEMPQRALGDGRLRLSSLSLGVSRQDMSEIEEIRDGGDLVLGLSPGGLVHLEGDFYTLYPSNHQLIFTVPQSEWIRLVRGVGYTNALMIELQLPDDQSSSDISMAVDSLDRAQAAYSRGDYEEAVADCRSGFAVLGRLGDDRFKTTNSSPTASKEERFWRVHKALLSVTHAAHHPEDAVSNDSDEEVGSERAAWADWGRVDAYAVIVMLAASISQRVHRM